MVKSYLKYEHSKTFGLITSSTSNIVWSAEDHGALSKTSAGRAIVAANEEVLCWDVKKGEIVGRWKDATCRFQVTVIAQSQTDPDIFAVGYEDGSIRLWDAKISSLIIRFNGHRSAITALAFDDSGVRLASGSRDTDITVWDLVAEVGLFKLRGHKDQITGLQFLQPREQVGVDGETEPSTAVVEGTETPEGFLLSTGKDSLIKLWDMTSQHCIETHIAQTNGECWALGIAPDGSGCITAGNDGELRVWLIDGPALCELSKRVEGAPNQQYLRDRGVLHRSGKDRALEISFHPREDYFAVHGSEKAVEIWRIRSPEEVKKSLARKRRRRREKLAAAGDAAADADEADKDISSAEVSDIFVSHLILRTGGRVRSAAWVRARASKAIQMLVATTSNQLEFYNIPVSKHDKKSKKDDDPDYTRTLSVDLAGHRADIRALALSADDKMLASASHGALKVWNVRTRNCIRTFECGYALCCAFLPGDKIIVVGTKTGELELFDVATATVLDTVNAHDGAVWSLQVHPDGKSVASGSADKSVKFWNFEVVQEEIPGTKRTTPRLKLVQTRTLKVADDILCLRFSPDARLLAVSLLDSTVKVFFADSLKPFLNLYGHKLPVLSMDISYDSKLIVTCSADKNVRLWGLDFGDCHKAFFAHQDSILQVAFVPHNQEGNGHHFFSSSKDKLIKYWDGDKFEQIQQLDGHFGEIWALAVSRTGAFLVTASHDKSIRVWEQTDEQIFLEEEREKELEALYESTLTAARDDEPPEGDEAVAAGQQTAETLMAGEKLMEALDLAVADLALMRDWAAARAAQPTLAPPARHPQYRALGGIRAEEHVLRVLRAIPAAALHDALLVLPFAHVAPLLTVLDALVSRDGDGDGSSTGAMHLPLVCRVLFFVLHTHHRTIVATRHLRALLDALRAHLRAALHADRARLGRNAAALRVVAAQVRSAAVSDYVDAAPADALPVRKRGFVSVA